MKWDGINPKRRNIELQIPFDGESFDHFEPAVLIPCQSHLYDCGNLYDRGHHLRTLLCGTLPFGLSTSKLFFDTYVIRYYVNCIRKQWLYCAWPNPICNDYLIVGCQSKRQDNEKGSDFLGLGWFNISIFLHKKSAKDRYFFLPWIHFFKNRSVERFSPQNEDFR